jgi:hypothetical protein
VQLPSDKNQYIKNVIQAGIGLGYTQGKVNNHKFISESIPESTEKTILSLTYLRQIKC